MREHHLETLRVLLPKLGPKCSSWLSTHASGLVCRLHACTCSPDSAAHVLLAACPCCCCCPRPQVFVTSTARCLDLATALVLPSSVMLLLDSLEGKDAIRERLDKYIFPADKVTVREVHVAGYGASLLGVGAWQGGRKQVPGTQGNLVFLSCSERFGKC